MEGLGRLDLPARWKRHVPPWLTAIAIGCVACGSAAGLRWAIHQVWPTVAPLGLFFPAILIATLLGRWLAGITCIFAGAAIVSYFIVPSMSSFGIDGSDAVALLFTYILIGSLMLLIAESWRTSEDKLAHERTLRLQAETDQQRLLAQELNHRIKNTLATVQAIAIQTLGRDDSARAGFRAFQDRLTALARAHSLLTKVDWTGSTVNDLVVAATAPFEDGNRFAIAGPVFRLGSKQSIALSLGLHELATNALKYGALSTPEGTVEIGWTIDGDRLHLHWTERHGPIVSPPSHSGFGTRLLERSLAAELMGTVTLSFQSEGLRCDIRAQFNQ
jgi:two-component sensor histidine kinase